MLGNQILLVNTFPSCIRPHIFDDKITNKLYSFIDDHYNATRFDYYLDSDEDTYNVLVVGPTGAGKSHLINVFFNQAICESQVSHHSVTREIYFIRGRGRVYNIQRREFVEQNIVVADTIGLCDTDWDDAKIINLIKGRVCSNFKSIDAVYIVFRADRLLKDHVANIKHILQWLSYEKGDNLLRFQFVGTYADYLDTNKKNLLRKEATEILGLKETEKEFVHTGEKFQSLVYTGFPPEDTLNDMTKARVVESWDSLRMLLTIPGITNRISISQYDNSCTLL
jgi:GTPase SAR1 family protein